MSPLALLGATVLLMGAACDKFSLKSPPAPPADETTAPAAPRTAAAAATPAKTPKPTRATGRPAEYDPAMASRRFDALRRGLRRLVVAQETYYAENGVYTDDLGRLRVTPEAGTEMRFLWLTRAGWAASGTHPDVPGRDCVVYVGRDHGPPTTLHDLTRRPRGNAGLRRPARSAPEIRQSPPQRPSRRPAPEAPQSAAQRRRPGLTPAVLWTTLSRRIQMRVDLRNLVRSQESYLGTQGIYSRRTEPFALQYLWRRGVTIRILSANDASWAARATHESRPGKSCVIWVGPVAQRPVTEMQKRSPEQPGTPSLRRLGAPRRPAVAHRRHLRQNRQRRLGGLAAAQVQADRAMDAGDLLVVNPVSLSHSRRVACVLREPIAPITAPASATRVVARARRTWGRGTGCRRSTRHRARSARRPPPARRGSPGRPGETARP